MPGDIFQFIQLGALLRLHHSQVVWACPRSVYPFASLAYLVGAAPRAALSPSRVVRPYDMYPFLHLSELVYLPL